MSGIRLHVQRLDNESFIATILRPNETSIDVEEFLNHRNPPYDDRGALYYVVVVILIYGLSIILMISSSVRKGKKDNGVNNYMRDMDKLRQLERRQQKSRIRLCMQKKSKNILTQNITISNIPMAVEVSEPTQNVCTEAETSQWSPESRDRMRDDPKLPLLPRNEMGEQQEQHKGRTKGPPIS